MLFIRSQYHLTSDIYDLLQVWNTKINFSLYYSTEVIYSQLSLNGHLYKTDASVKQTPRVGPCLSLLPLFDSL